MIAAILILAAVQTATLMLTFFEIRRFCRALEVTTTLTHPVDSGDGAKSQTLALTIGVGES